MKKVQILMIQASMLFNFIRSTRNQRKKLDDYNILRSPKIEIERSLSYSNLRLKSFRKLAHWKKTEIPPTFPYALATPLHFALVNKNDFPFSPYGLIHKREQIFCDQPLKPGEWNMKCFIQEYRRVENGFEFDLISHLSINKHLVWKSTTTAFKKLTSKKKKSNSQQSFFEHKNTWKLGKTLGLQYGLLSQNIDPIHLFPLTAKIMGHPKPLIHGMYLVARGLSQKTALNYPLNFSAKFLAPVYLPAEVHTQEYDSKLLLRVKNSERNCLEVSF